MPAVANSFTRLARNLIDEELHNTDAGYKHFNELLKDTSKYGKLEVYRDHPIAFCYKVLGVTLTPDQKRIFKLLQEPPHRLLVSASHSVGKSYIAACLILWYFFTHKDSITTVLAPTSRQVTNVIFALVRSLNNVDKSVHRGEYSPKLYISEVWNGSGYSASSGDSIQGQHGISGDNLIIVDEATGLKPQLWEALNGLDSARGLWLAIFNPTSTNSQVYNEWQNTTKWKRLTINSLNHPNIIAGLKGEPEPFKGAVSLEHVNSQIESWSSRISIDDKGPRDIEWPPGSGIWRRPNALMESRILGRWPTQNYDTVFDALDVENAIYSDQPFDKDGDIVVGIDIATSGSDYLVIMARVGNHLILHERRNGLDTVEITGLLIDILRDLGDKYDVNYKNIQVNVDSTGIGAAISDNLYDQQFYNVEAIHFGQTAQDYDKYPDARSELWFTMSEKCKNGQVSLDLLDEQSHDLIRSQLIAPQYEHDVKGRRRLEPKKQTKKRIGISPDDADALCLCYYEAMPTITISKSD